MPTDERVVWYYPPRTEELTHIDNEGALYTIKISPKEIARVDADGVVHLDWVRITAVGCTAMPPFQERLLWAVCRALLAVHDKTWKELGDADRE